MPLQNRVTPDGEMVAVSARGSLMGNRGGRLHNEDRALGRRRWVTKQWICCRLEFNGRRRQVMAPNRYTELFFLDEATALAAGHRPCFECRRQEFVWFATLWNRVRGLEGRATAPAMDEVLHLERVDATGGKPIWAAPIADLPSGTMIRIADTPHLVLSGWLLPWTHDGYGVALARPDEGDVAVLTPRATTAVLAAGYCPALHTSAGHV